MSALQRKTYLIPKQWELQFWLGCFALLLLSPFLFYYGYCWGLWGRNSLLFQYLFQCNCPASSEETRYPKEVDIIISACQPGYIELSPSGRLLYVRYKALTYLLDLQTRQRIDISNQPPSSFLTDNLGFIEDGITDYVIDRTTGKQYPIKAFRFWRENTYVNGKPNLEMLISSLHQAEQVFLTQNFSTVVVLMPDFFTDPEQSFTFSLFDFPAWDHHRVEQFLQENNIIYQIIPPSYPHEVRSRDGRFIARDDGIYLVKTNQIIVKAPVSFVRGWVDDGRGVIYAAPRRCLLTLGFPMMDDSWCEIEVPQPVLLLKVPEEYLLSKQTP